MVSYGQYDAGKASLTSNIHLLCPAHRHNSTKNIRYTCKRKLNDTIELNKLVYLIFVKPEPVKSEQRKYRF